MSKDEVIKEMCQIRGLVFYSMKDFSEPCDCFCGRYGMVHASFSSTSKEIDYIRKAVEEKLLKDGYELAK